MGSQQQSNGRARSHHPREGVGGGLWGHRAWPGGAAAGRGDTLACTRAWHARPGALFLAASVRARGASMHGVCLCGQLGMGPASARARGGRAPAGARPRRRRRLLCRDPSRNILCGRRGSGAAAGPRDGARRRAALRPLSGAPRAASMSKGVGTIVLGKMGEKTPSLRVPLLAESFILARMLVPLRCGGGSQGARRGARQGPRPTRIKKPSAIVPSCVIEWPPHGVGEQRPSHIPTHSAHGGRGAPRATVGPEGKGRGLLRGGGVRPAGAPGAGAAAPAGH
ncbi:MAG: hypothetical protein J3K34DRAFT_402865 [Monoraphidium minutum]|nr:MAG: hypothetical protein J3K34DRAFT_402865 [Monoraphidium minutum]